jgi:hypothetical protein
MMFIRSILIVLCFSSLSACSQATLLSSIGVGMGVAQKSTLSTVYSGVDLGVSSTTGKSIREHVLETPTDTEGSHYVEGSVDTDNNTIEWVTPK